MSILARGFRMGARSVLAPRLAVRPLGGALPQQQRMNSTESGASGAAETATQSLHPLFEAVEPLTPLTNSPPDLILGALEQLHLAWQIPYWESIAVTTIAMRVILLPLGVKMAQSSARMAAVRPLLTKVTDAMKKDPQGNNSARKKAYSEQSKALLKQYNVNPFLSLLMPLIQLPIFMSFFFALQKMGEYFPGATTGGLDMFPDLTVADPTMILPILNSLSFLMMIELGGDGMAANDQTKFKWVMRGLAVFMTPMTMALPVSVFYYWTTNNALSVIQATALKNQTLKDYLGMPAPPKQSDSKLMGGDENPIAKAFEGLKKEFTAPTGTEIVDGSAGAAMPLSTPSGPPPATFSAPQRSKKDKKSGRK